MYKQSTVTGFIKFINRLGRKKPKWETDSDWMKDEAASELLREFLSAFPRPDLVMEIRAH